MHRVEINTSFETVMRYTTVGDQRDVREPAVQDLHSVLPCGIDAVDDGPKRFLCLQYAEQASKTIRKGSFMCMFKLLCAAGQAGRFPVNKPPGGSATEARELDPKKDHHFRLCTRVFWVSMKPGFISGEDTPCNSQHFRTWHESGVCARHSGESTHRQGRAVSSGHNALFIVATCAQQPQSLCGLVKAVQASFATFVRVSVLSRMPF